MYTAFIKGNLNGLKILNDSIELNREAIKEWVGIIETNLYNLQSAIDEENENE
jgi:hypothetical protein